MAEIPNIIVGVKLDTSNIGKQVEEISKKFETKPIKLGFEFKLTNDNIKQQMKVIQDKFDNAKINTNITVGIKVDSRIGDINRQINQLSKQITEQLSVKLKIDASDLNIITEKTKRVQEQVQIAMSQKNVKQTPISYSSREYESSLLGTKKSDIDKALDDVISSYKGKLSDIKVNLNESLDIGSVVVKYKDSTGKMIQETMKWVDVVEGQSNKAKKAFKTVSTQIVDDMRKEEQQKEAIRKREEQELASRQKRIDKFKDSTLNRISEMESKDYKYANQLRFVTPTSQGNVELKKIRSVVEALNASTISSKQFDKEIKNITNSIDKLENKAIKLYKEIDQEAKNATRGIKASFSITPLGDYSTPGKKAGIQNPASFEKSTEATRKYLQLISQFSGKKLDFGIFESQFSSKQMKETGQLMTNIGVRVWHTKKRYEDLTVSLNDSDKSFRYLSKSIKNAGLKDLNFSGQFIENLKKFPIWLGTATIVMQGLALFRTGAQYIYEMDKALTDLTKVVDLSIPQMHEMTNAAVAMGNAYGKSSVEIMKSMAEFGRVTKNTDEIKKLTESATLASNVTTMTADVAAKALNTTMMAFKINAKDSMGIVDKWNELKFSISDSLYSNVYVKC